MDREEWRLPDNVEPYNWKLGAVIVVVLILARYGLGAIMLWWD